MQESANLTGVEKALDNKSIMDMFEEGWNQFQVFVREEAPAIPDETLRAMLLKSVERSTETALVLIAISVPRIAVHIQKRDSKTLLGMLKEKLAEAGQKLDWEPREDVVSRALDFGEFFLGVLIEINK